MVRREEAKLAMDTTADEGAMAAARSEVRAMAAGALVEELMKLTALLQRLRRISSTQSHNCQPKESSLLVIRIRHLLCKMPNTLSMKFEA